MLEFSTTEMVGLVPFRLSINAKTHCGGPLMPNQLCQSLVAENNIIS